MTGREPVQLVGRDQLAIEAAELGATLAHDDDVSKVSVVGAGMRNLPGVAEKMFAALAVEAVHIQPMRGFGVGAEGNLAL